MVSTEEEFEHLFFVVLLELMHHVALIPFFCLLQQGVGYVTPTFDTKFNRYV